MTIKAVLAVGLILVGIAVQGCSSDPPKAGIAPQKDDYKFAPGQGKKPGSPG